MAPVTASCGAAPPAPAIATERRPAGVGWRTLAAGTLFAVLTTIGTPPAARAQDAEARIADGRQRYADLDYEGAAAVLEGALDLARLPPAAEARALETLGFSYVVLERLRDARRAFERLFAIDPYYDVREPTGSPRVEEFAPPKWSVGG